MTPMLRLWVRTPRPELQVSCGAVHHGLAGGLTISSSPIFDPSGQGDVLHSPSYTQAPSTVGSSGGSPIPGLSGDEESTGSNAFFTTF